MNPTHTPCDSISPEPALDEIIAQQGKKPTTDLSVLHGHFWPEEETVEEFLAFLDDSRERRRHGSAA